MEFALAVIGVLAGLLAGWLLWARTLGALRGAGDAQLQQLRDLQKDLDVERQRVAGLAALQGELAAMRSARHAAETELAVRVAAQAESDKAYEARLTELREAKELLTGQFREVGAKLLGEAQAAFLSRADERFQQAGEKGEAQLKALLAPVETTLKRYEEGLARVEKERVGSYGELREALAHITINNEVVRKETARLTNVLRSSPKARGRWGEEQLRNILEAAGLAENVDFALQSSVSDGEKQLRPDCVINLPGGHCIVVDVKCPLVHFEQAYDEEDEVLRAGLLLQHANAMKSYAADLGRKGYWRQFDLSPDFVIMYIPGEHFLSAAAERAPDLIESAFRNGVIVASTINMLALAKMMAGMWRQEKLAEEAQKIGQLGKDLYARLAVMGGHVAKLGRNLGLAAGAYNDFVGSLESQVMTQARRFEALNIDTGGKAIDPLALVDTSIRPLTKLIANDGAE